MPVMDGYEAAAALRSAGYQGKIIALTAHAMIDEKQKCMQRGFSEQDNNHSKAFTKCQIILKIKRPFSLHFF